MKRNKENITILWHRKDQSIKMLKSVDWIKIKWTWNLELNKKLNKIINARTYWICSFSSSRREGKITTQYKQKNINCVTQKKIPLVPRHVLTNFYDFRSLCLNFHGARGIYCTDEIMIVFWNMFELLDICVPGWRN